MKDGVNNMLREEEISQLLFAIELTEAAAAQTGTPSIMELHRRCIERYKKRLSVLEGKCYTCEKSCEEKCVLEEK